MRSSILLAAAATFAAAACAAEPPAAPALVVLDGATNIRSERGFGSDGVEYDLPAGDGNAVVARIHRRLLEQGFAPTAELWDLRGPNSSSFSTGWQCFPVSLRRLEEGLRYQWIADWRNAAGDVTTYTIGCSAVPPRCERIDIAANLMPASRIPPDEPNPVVSGEPVPTISPDCQTIRRELDRKLREGS